MEQIPFIDLRAQYRAIQDEIDAAIRNVITDTAFVGGPYLKTFEQHFAAYCQTACAVGASSGTTALHLVFAALEIGPGDEVITVPNTFIATVETIAQTGAKPVFVDVREDTLNLDPEKLEAAITDRTRAIVPVHLYGQIADMGPIMEIARANNLAVVEDAAQAHGAEYQKKRAGHFGVAATFSFYPGKILGAYGDAGMVITSDPELGQKMEMLANHGRLDKYKHRMPGYNYRMDGMQAAILDVKLNYLEGWIEKRRERSHLYNWLFSENNIQTPIERSGNHHVYTYYVIRSPRRDAMQEALQQENISAIIHYPIPLHLQPAFADLGYREGDFPVAETATGQILSLPLYPELENDQIHRIAEIVIKALA